jgi:hypothetical protein
MGAPARRVCERCHVVARMESSGHAFGVPEDNAAQFGTGGALRSPPKGEG